GTVTLDGTMGGTFAFAAPEMVTDFRRAGPLADQYGAAATLYCLLAGYPPHHEATVAARLDSIRTRDAVPLGGHRAALPGPLPTAIQRAVDRDPRRRFPTVQALREALLPYAD